MRIDGKLRRLEDEVFATDEGDRIPLPVLHELAAAHERQQAGLPATPEQKRALVLIRRRPGWRKHLEEMAAIADECGAGRGEDRNGSE